MFVVMLCKVWQINVLYFVSVQFLAKSSMFFKVWLKKKKKKTTEKKNNKVFEKERNYGEAFAPWQGSSNKMTPMTFATEGIVKKNCRTLDNVQHFS